MASMGDVLAQHDPDVVAEVRGKSRAEVEEFLFTMLWLDRDRERLLDAIPECPAHGRCVPYALRWIEVARGVVPVLAPDEEPPLLGVADVLGPRWVESPCGWRTGDIDSGRTQACECGLHVGEPMEGIAPHPGSEVPAPLPPRLRSGWGGDTDTLPA